MTAETDVGSMLAGLCELTLVLCRQGCVNGREVSYKQVAVVENFFDIIYNVHVEMDVRGGKHAGQKRTYRAVSVR